jgi:hypothetical protein
MTIRSFVIARPLVLAKADNAEAAILLLREGDGHPSPMR